MSDPHAAIRLRVADAARSWLGTPYRHHGRIKGVGVDCAQLLAAVGEEAGLTPPVDLGNYPRLHHMSHSEERFLEWLQALGAHQIERPGLGDMGVWKFGLAHSHGGIVVEVGDDPLIVHSYIRAARGVTLTRASEHPLSSADGVTWWSVFE